MQEETSFENQDEISLIDLLAVLLRYKRMVISVTLITMVVAVVVSVISLKLPPEKSFMPNKYTVQAQMLINNENSDSGISNLLSSSGMSSLANLAGMDISSGTASNSALASYLVHSNTTLDNIVEKFGLVERYKIKKHEKSVSREILKEKLVPSFDEDTGVFSVAFTDIDPVFAQSVANHVVDLLETRFDMMGVDKNKLAKKNLENNIETAYNEIINLQKQIHEIEFSASNIYTSNSERPIMLDATLLKTELSVQQEIYAQLKLQLELLKSTMASEQPIFQILEYAEVPDRKSEPSRGMLCIIATFTAFFISVFVAFMLNAIKNIKNDPEAMEKLRSTKR